MSQAFQQALTELRPEEVSFILSHLAPVPDTAETVDASLSSPIVDTGTESDDDADSRRRRHIDREWPEIGTVLTAEYYGEQYTAEIIAATKRLKSGKQIRIASGPSKGAICDSFSEAMLAATEMQRATQNLARKGVSNGWLFWNWPGKPEDIAGDEAEDRVA